MVAGTFLVTGSAAAAPGGISWNSAGGDRQNTRYAASEAKISPTTVGGLRPKWVFTTGGDVSATPAVDGQRVYFPDWAGNLYAVDKATGGLAWQRKISDYTGIPGDKARATPAFTDSTLVIGNQGPSGGGGAVLAIDKASGALLWKTQLESHPSAIITQSLDLATGRILWKTYLTPSEAFPGNAVWGSSPAIDTKRHSVYISSGNNYDVPDSVFACIAAAGSDPTAQRACLPADNHFDSILSLDMSTGAIKWATRALPFDAWTVACVFEETAPNCPQPAGPDYDFGQAPALFRAGNGDELLGAGQKSGQYWALDPDSGAVRWVTDTGPGGTAGGLQWGSAVDGRRSTRPTPTAMPSPTWGPPTASGRRSTRPAAASSGSRGRRAAAAPPAR